jgi:hypothetical protein
MEFSADLEPQQLPYQGVSFLLYIFWKWQHTTAKYFSRRGNNLGGKKD